MRCLRHFLCSLSVTSSPLSSYCHTTRFHHVIYSNWDLCGPLGIPVLSQNTCWPLYIGLEAPRQKKLLLTYGRKLPTALLDVKMFHVQHFLHWPPRALILHEKKLGTKCDATRQTMEIALTGDHPEQPRNGTSAEKILAVCKIFYIISINHN